MEEEIAQEEPRIQWFICIVIGGCFLFFYLVLVFLLILRSLLVSDLLLDQRSLRPWWR